MGTADEVVQYSVTLVGVVLASLMGWQFVVSWIGRLFRASS